MNEQLIKKRIPIRREGKIIYQERFVKPEESKKIATGEKVTDEKSDKKVEIKKPIVKKEDKTKVKIVKTDDKKIKSDKDQKYFYKYTNGDKWVQVNGIGDDPKNCKISWDCSENNEDIHIVMTTKTARSPLYGWVEFNDLKVIGNIYVQVLRINPIIKEGYKCESHQVPKVEPLLPDPQIIVPEKDEENETISINKSELSKAVNVGAESGESGYTFVPQSYDKKDKKYEDSVVTDITTWVKESQKTLEAELKRFYESA